ncbi:MAG: Holliday junction branch migration protein RuvA [Candidatus Omnitrophica bacterium]|nr:Holliday junction branch migration protein RuvA [Candidatus Omnitrophota bacterium]
MISLLEGRLIEKAPTQVTVEVNGVGYLLQIPVSVYESLGECGSPVRFYTTLYVREEKLELYGFASQEQRQVFQLLVTIPGVGPRVALRILSGMTPAQLQEAIVRQDTALLTRVPGIGKKLGERLVTELKEQFSRLPLGKIEKVGPAAETVADAIEALVILGYKKSQAISCVNAIAREWQGRQLSTETLIKEALKRL